MDIPMIKPWITALIGGEAIVLFVLAARGIGIDTENPRRGISGTLFGLKRNAKPIQRVMLAGGGVMCVVMSVLYWFFVP